MPSGSFCMPAIAAALALCSASVCRQATEVKEAYEGLLIDESTEGWVTVKTQLCCVLITMHASRALQ